MSQRKKRIVLSIEEKQRILEIKEENPKMTYSEIVDEFYKLTKKQISESSVQKIWANKENIRLGLDGKNSQPKSEISISKETIERIEEARRAEKPISESFVIAQAQKVVQQNKLNPEKYYFSPAWASNIMKGKIDDKSILKESKPKEIKVKKENTKIGVPLSV